MRKCASQENIPMLAQMGGVIMPHNRNSKPSLQYLALAGAVIICVLMALVVNLHYGIDIIYTHLFYIPIVMAGVWYHRRALLVAGGLGAVHIACDYAINHGVTSNSLLRTAMFLGIALAVGLLSEKRDLLYQELQKINNAMLDMITEVDSSGEIGYISSSSMNILGYAPEEMLGTSILDLVHPDDLELVKEKFGAAINSRVSMRLDYRYRHKDGSYIWVESLANPVMEDSKRLSVYIFGSRDITARKKAEEELQYLSMHDPMTGLYNRLYFEEEMKRLNSGRFDPVGIVVADIDGLKTANDTLGHVAGDRLIVTAGKFLLSQFRASDMVARIGGDEFAVLLPSCSQAAWEDVVKRISNKDAAPMYTEDGVLLRISVGYALKTNKQESLEGLFREADAMMYRNKAANKERHRLLEGIAGGKAKGEELSL